MTSPPVVVVPSEDFPAIIERVAAIDDDAARVSGHEVLGAAVWRDLERPAAESAGVFSGDGAYAHVARSDTFAPQHWVVGLAVRPDTDPDPRPVLLATAVDHVTRHGGDHVVAWVFAARPEDDDALAVAGFAPVRDLYEMRVSLPVREAIVWPDGTEVRDFAPGRDDDAWLDVNNRAFANHADQGAWVRSTLARRMSEPWFDPSIFVLAFDAEGLAGYNWCKVHPARDGEPARGEIFVIGVDPRVAGRGFGRPLALEGLSRLHARGLSTAKLFTDADNARAIALYESIGFSVHRVDRCYARELTRP